MSDLPNALATAEDFEFAALSEAENYRNALLREFSKHLCGQVLEVGSGIGQITGELLKNRAITKLVSIEPDSKFHAKLNETFPAHTVIHGTIDDLNSNENWNTIVSINVLEHIADDGIATRRKPMLNAPIHQLVCRRVPAILQHETAGAGDIGHA